MKRQTTVHMCIDVRGVLAWNDRDLKRLFKAEDGKLSSAMDIRNYLYDKLSDGWDVIPFGEPCEGFDKKKGCPGHTKKLKP